MSLNTALTQATQHELAQWKALVDEVNALTKQISKATEAILTEIATVEGEITQIDGEITMRNRAHTAALKAFKQRFQKAEADGERVDKRVQELIDERDERKIFGCPRAELNEAIEHVDRLLRDLKTHQHGNYNAITAIHE